MTDRIEVPRTIAASAADIFAVLCDPQGHVAIDSSGMLQDADGGRVRSFVVHRSRSEELPDLGKYDVAVDHSRVREGPADIGRSSARSVHRSATSTVTGSSQPQTTPSSRRCTDWTNGSGVRPTSSPVISEGALRATLGVSTARPRAATV